MSGSQSSSRIHVRWMIRRDMKRVEEIENDSFESPWSDDDFYQQLKKQFIVGKVAEIDEDVAGYILYELNPRFIEILNIAVDASVRRSGVGAVMLDDLKQKLCRDGRSRITALVREGNFPAQVFFRCSGFVADRIERQPYDTSNEDGYRMSFRPFALKRFETSNRIKALNN